MHAGSMHPRVVSKARAGILTACTTQHITIERLSLTADYAVCVTPSLLHSVAYAGHGLPDSTPRPASHSQTGSNHSQELIVTVGL